MTNKAQSTLPKELLADIKRQAQNTTHDTNKKGAIDKLITIIFEKALRLRASDIHIEPLDYTAVVRLRVDGVLFCLFEFELDIFAPLASKIKVLAGMDIAERRKAQDGRMVLDILDYTLDFRVSALPTITGESIAIRILDKTKAAIDITELGMNTDNLSKLSKAITSPNGIVLVTGPTGSGKTTTLYTALGKIKSATKKIITVEDPVEYRLELVQQVQTNDKAGLGFANALRAILRQDPDVLMIGEIRDAETLRIAVQASLTGHLVLSTLHTNDAISTISRMRDMGLESYLLGASLRAVLSQRLVRRLCPHCKRPVAVKNLADEIAGYFDGIEYIYGSCGCEKCAGSGYFGREMISEIIVISSQIAHLISKEAHISDILQQAIDEGFVSKLEDGMVKVRDGITSIDELLRVVWFEPI